MKNETSPESIAGTCCEKSVPKSEGVFQRLRELSNASEALKDALIRRDPDAILAITGVQEELACWFRSQITTTRPEREDCPAGGEKRIRDLVAGIRRTQRTNMALAESFLVTINMTLSSLGLRGRPGEGIYGASGNLDTVNSPLLVLNKG